MDKKMILSTEELTCEICSKVFDRRSRLEAHYKTHTGEKPFVCPYCQKTFTTRGNCNTHIRVHTRERPYQCSHCDKSFSQRGQLVIHVRRHTGEKPFICRHCQKGFSCTKVLKIHLRTHTGEKPFSCEFCQKSFAAYANLVVHRRIHTRERPYTCKLCGRGFEHSGNLSRHLRVHKVDNGIRCIPCGEVFTEESALIDHTHAAHPNEKEKEDELDVEVPEYSHPPPIKDTLGKNGYQPQIEMIPTSVSSSEPVENGNYDNIQELVIPETKESRRGKSPVDQYHDDLTHQMMVDDRRSNETSLTNLSDSGNMSNSPISSDCSSDRSNGNGDNCIPDESYTIKSSIPTVGNQKPLTIKIKLPNQKYRHYHPQYKHAKFKAMQNYVQENEHCNEGPSEHQNSEDSNDVPANLNHAVNRLHIDRGIANSQPNTAVEAPLSNISRKRPYVSSSDSARDWDHSRQRRSETNGEYNTDYNRENTNYGSTSPQMSHNDALNANSLNYETPQPRPIEHSPPINGIKVRHVDAMQEASMYGKTKRTAAAPPPLIPISGERSRPQATTTSEPSQASSDQCQYTEVSTPYPEIINCEREDSSTRSTSPYSDERKEDKKILFPESSTSDVPLEDIKQNIHMTMRSLNTTCQDSNGFKSKVEMVIRMLIGESNMAQLGYPSKNIEQILIQILDMAGKIPCADVRVDEMKRMKVNVQKFLEYFLPPEAFGPEAIIDTLTSYMGRRRQPQERTSPYSCMSQIQPVAQLASRNVIHLPPVSNTFIGIEGKKFG